MIIVIPLLLPTVLGYLIVCAVLSNDKNVSTIERWAFSYPLGIGLMAIQIFILGFAGIPLKRPVTVSLLLTEIVAVSIWLYCRKINIFAGKSGSFEDNEMQSSHLFQKIINTILGIWISLKLVTIFFETYLRPIYAFDSFVNWSVRAKVFYHSNSLLLNPAAYDFFGRGINHSSANYPPINPLVQMWIAQWLGCFDEVLVKLWSPIFLLCMVVYLYIVAARETNRFIALLMVTIVVSSPLVSIHATETLSDLPLAVYILFALSSLQNVIRGRWAYLPLVGLFSVCAIQLKGEGTFFALPLFISSCYIVWSEARSGKRSVSSLLAPLLLPYLFVLPWFVFRNIYQLGYGMDEIYPTLVFRPMIILNYLQLILGLQNFNVVFLFIPIMLLLHGRFDKELSLMLFTIGAYVIFFLSLYVTVAFYTDNERFAEGVFRNALTYYPSTLLIMILLIKRLLPNRNSSTVQQL